MRAFHLQRVVDESGISGTGRVAEGVEFANGWCAMVWLTAHTSCAFYANIEEVLAIHGHGGKTEVVFEPGVRPDGGRFENIRHHPARQISTARQSFAILWDSINGKRANWDSNPWVWVISFRRAALVKEAA